MWQASNHDHNSISVGTDKFYFEQSCWSSSTCSILIPGLVPLSKLSTSSPTNTIWYLISTEPGSRWYLRDKCFCCTNPPCHPSQVWTEPTHHRPARNRCVTAERMARIPRDDESVEATRPYLGNLIRRSGCIEAAAVVLAEILWRWVYDLDRRCGCLPDADLVFGQARTRMLYYRQRAEHIRACTQSLRQYNNTSKPFYSVLSPRCQHWPFCSPVWPLLYYCSV